MTDNLTPKKQFSRGVSAITIQMSQASICSELTATLGDITAFAHIGCYDAAKIEAALSGSESLHQPAKSKPSVYLNKT